MRIEVSGLSLVVVTVAVCLVHRPVAAAPADHPRVDLYTHLVYPQVRKKAGGLGGEFVLHRIHPLADATGAESRRVISTGRQIPGNDIQAVSNGRLYVSGYMAKASVIDIRTGNVSSLGKSPMESLRVIPQRDAIIFTMPQLTPISRYDISSQSTTQLLKGSVKRSTSFATQTHGRIAITPDGKFLATATYAGNPDNGLIPYFEIHIMDLTAEPPTVRLLKQRFGGGVVGTGGGHHAYAPAMYFKDKQTLLLAAAPKTASPNPRMIRHDVPLRLYEVNTKSLVSNVVCDLPFPIIAGMTQFDPDFWLRADGELMMFSKSLGDHRVDLTNKQVFSDRHLSPNYELRGDVHKPSLWAGDLQLAARVNTWDVSVSPDGRQIVWMVPFHGHQYGSTHAEKSFFLHSAKTGIVVLGQGRFDLSNSQPTHPILHPPVHWLTDQDLPAKQPDA